MAIARGLGGALSNRCGIKIPTGGLSKNVGLAVGNVVGRIQHQVNSYIKEKKLPTTGKIRFIPRDADIKNGKVFKQNGGYLDKFGNTWKKGPSRTIGQDFEWDVQLSKTGKSTLGHLSTSGSHINVNLDGKISH